MHLPTTSQLLSPAQLVGYLAFVLGITAFLQRDDRRLKGFLASECATYVAHFLLLGNPVASASSGVSGCRTLLSLRFRSRRLMIALMLVYLAVGAALARSPAGWLPVVGSCFATWALFTLRGVRLRLAILASTLLWLANNLLSGSVGGSLLEALIAATSVTTILRMVRQPGGETGTRP